MKLVYRKIDRPRYWEVRNSRLRRYRRGLPTEVFILPGASVYCSNCDSGAEYVGQDSELYCSFCMYGAGVDPRAFVAYKSAR